MLEKKQMARYVVILLLISKVVFANDQNGISGASDAVNNEKKDFMGQLISSTKNKAAQYVDSLDNKVKNVKGVFSLGVNSLRQAIENLDIDKHADALTISKESQSEAGIRVSKLAREQLPLELKAPCEILANANKSAIVTPRVRSQVVERIAEVGEQVEKGAPLVKLTSVEMAKAQADLLLSYKEWKRVKGLGVPAIAAKRYQAAEIAYHQAMGRLMAYGMRRNQVQSFLNSNAPDKANGQFTLEAPRAGNVFSADFNEGQMIEPGRTLYKIIGEEKLWADASLEYSKVDGIQKGDAALVMTRKVKLPGKVLRVHHHLKKTTRMQTVRIEVQNINDQLHPGEFATCVIQTGKTEPVLAVPINAVVRTEDGDQGVYVQVSPTQFKLVEVTPQQTIGEKIIVKGLKGGEKVVTEGAFYVNSEALKTGFETHNH